MIPKLRRKFISITAAALFSIILLVITAINLVFIFQCSRQLDSRLSWIMDKYSQRKTPGYNHFRDPNSQTPDSGPGYPEPQTPDSGPADYAPELPDSMSDYSDSRHNAIDTPASPEKPAGFIKPFALDLLIRADGCLIVLNEEGALLELLQDSPDHYSEEDMETLAHTLYEQGKEKGWYRYFKYRMEIMKSPDQNSRIVIGLVNASSDLYSVFSMLLISVSIGILSFLLVLFIVIIASGKAVRPIAESYAKQKQFVTNAGHELKTPLTVISADNELSRMIYGDSQWFDSIDSQITKMNGLIRSLITLARMDEEEKPVFTSFNLSDAVYDTAKSFEKLIHAQGKLITFDITDDIIYLGDESGIRQLTAILMDNAAKYCDKQGKIAVRLTGDKPIRLQVINDYAAAADCDLSRVFERFYRADKARTSDGSYGLGLSIAKSIAELHKGEIRARVLEYNRLMFEVVLPCPARKKNTPA